MTLVGTADIVGPAYLAGRAAVAFNIVGLEHAEAIVEGATRAGTPVILQISHNCVDYHGSLTPIALATLAVARGAGIPVAVHLDHARTMELVEEAIDLGIGSVMYDASELDDDMNLERTRAVAAACHGRGVWVEAELGEVGGKDGVHGATARTDPGVAARFVAATGADALAVAVGSSHARPVRDAMLDLDLVAHLRAAVPVPLVLHGSSSAPDELLVAAIRAGLTKVNIATQLNRVFTVAVRGSLDGNPTQVDPRRYLGPGRDAVSHEVERLLLLLARAG